MKITINNLELATNISKSCWKNEDMYSIMEIRQRFKDNNNVLDETNNGIFFPKLNKMDNNDNLIALAVIKGNTLDDFIHRLYNPILYIFPEYRGFLGCNEYFECTDNNMNNVISVCNKLNARAYLGQMRLSYKRNKKREVTNFNLPVRIKHLLDKNDKPSRVVKFTYVSNNQDKGGWFYGFIDIDVDDMGVVNQVIGIIRHYNITNYYVVQSHNGYHLIFLWEDNNIYSNKSEIKSKINNELLQFGTQYVTGFGEDPNIKMEPLGFSKLLLYSLAGDKTRNTQHPDWIKGMVFPCNINK